MPRTLQDKRVAESGRSRVSMLICEGSGAITHSPRLRRNVKPLGERESLVCTLLRQANENKYRHDDDDGENGLR